MPTYYDKKAHTWFCKFYYTDAQGMRRQKKKRGFKRQRDAKAWNVLIYLLRFLLMK